MLTGSVSAAVSKGVLTITGSTAVERVTIEPTAQMGTVRITVADGTVNGTASAEIAGVTKDVQIFLNGGDDIVTLRGFLGAAALPRNLTIDAGDGNDVVDLQQVLVAGVTRITLGAGNDTLRIDDSQFTKKSTLEGDDGDDGILLDRRGDLPGTTQFSHKLIANLGAGTDIVRAGVDGDGSRRITVAKPFVINGGTETDTVAISGQSQANTKRKLVENDVAATLPQVTAGLANDTAPGGATNSDQVTGDASIAGVVTGLLSGGSLRGGLDDASVSGFKEVSAIVQANGSFTISAASIAAAFPGLLVDGPHLFYLQFVDKYGEASPVVEVPFTLDTTPPSATSDTVGNLDGSITEITLTFTEEMAANAFQGNAYQLIGPGGIEVPVTSVTQAGTGHTVAVLHFSSPLLDGGYTLTLLPAVADLAGNAVVQGAQSTFTIANPGTLLREQSQFATELAVPVTVGAIEGRRTLTFAVNRFFDVTDQASAVTDRLLVYLVSSQDASQTLLDRGVPGTAIFSLGESGIEFLPGLVSFDGVNVEIDVSSISGVTSGTLLFQLLGADSDSGTQVRIGDVVSTLDSEGIAREAISFDFEDAIQPGAAIDTSALIPTTTLAVSAHNVRFDAETGEYSFDIQVENQGDATGRDVIVAFPGLPVGVSLLNASGTTATGVSYVSLRDAIPNGGLGSSILSDRVTVTFSIPDGLQVPLLPQILVGSANRAPVLQPVAAKSTMPGMPVTFELLATDPDGDQVTLSIDSATPLPTGSMDADGRLTFTPAPNQLGTYTFDVVATDGQLTSRQTITLNVDPDPNTTTRISGRVLNTLEQPLAGVPVEIAGFSSVTDANGHFTIALPTMLLPTEPFDIAIPTGDVFLDPFGSGNQVIRFRRARHDTTTGDSVDNPRQHPNLVTSFIDASMVYGSTQERADALRTFSDGKLKSSEGNLLPLNDPATFPGGTLENDNEGRLDPATLFVAGDVRTNENVPLIAMHTILMREHNRLADEIKAAHPDFTDEQIYQQARRMVGAIVQHITYSEYLPLLIGSDHLEPYSGFDPSVDPRESMLFAAAAFRLGHTQLATEIKRLGADGESLPGGSLTLAQAFFRVQPINDDGIEPFLRGLAATPMQKMDRHIVEDVRSFLFGPPGAGGMDLAAMNIQRGRDVGLPSYNQARIDFGLAAVTSFDEISSDPATVAALASIYPTVNDIDVWVGGISEDPVAGALVGPLFQRIVGDQFQRSRDGDRFYFENGQFTAEDLNAIRSTSLESLIERNAPGVDLPSHAFTTGVMPTAPDAAGSASGSSAFEPRAADGSGNHVDDSNLGATGSHAVRNFTNGYADGISQPAGADRPNPRAVSNAVIAQPGDIPDPHGVTSLMIFWGQILDHDLGLTPGGVSNTLKINGNLRPNPSGDESYPFVAERMDLLFEHGVYPGVDNVVERPIYLPLLDMAHGTTIDPAQPVTVSQELANGGTAALFVEAGTLTDRQGHAFTNVLSITEVPRELTPAVLPEGLLPDTVVTIQPADLVLSTPAPLTLPNRSGLKPGVEMELWSINPTTGAFDIVGEGRVSADGQSIETTSGGIRNSSWHFFVCKIARYINEHLLDLQLGCNDTQAEYSLTSEVGLHSGGLTESHMTAAYQSLGVSRGVELVYDSDRTNNRRDFRLQFPEIDPGIVASGSGNPIEQKLYMEVTIINGTFEYPPQYKLFDLEDPESIDSLDVGMTANLENIPTGHYTLRYRAGIRIYQNGEILQESLITSLSEFVHINEVRSEFGSGWGIAGLQKLRTSQDGTVLLVDGDGSAKLFLPNGGGRFTSPEGDFSTLTKLSDGTFRHTQVDQTVAEFDARGLLTRITDRNHNIMTYDYVQLPTGTRAISTITDPVGLQTHFEYSGGLLAAIQDPTGRRTLINHDTARNLTSITDPDTTQRQFTYNASHKMTSETNQNGDREFTVWKDDRVIKSIRRDGSVIHVAAAQSQDLFSRNTLLQPVAHIVEANGNSIEFLLGRMGKLRSSEDAGGALTSVTRNSHDLISSVTDGRGNRTVFEYDSRGNVTVVQSDRFYVADSFSSGYSNGDLAGQHGGIGWSGDWTGSNSAAIDRSSSVSLNYPGLDSQPGGIVADGTTGSQSTTVARSVSLPTSDSMYVGVLANFQTLSSGNADRGTFLKLSDFFENGLDKVLLGRTYTAFPQFSITARNDNQPLNLATQSVAVAFGGSTGGALDPTFGGDGIVTTDFGFPTLADEQVRKLMIQSDGKIVAAGDGRGSGGLAGFLARYNTDGTLDPTFDGNGLAVLSIPSFNTVDAALQPDGKIVMLDGGFTVTRVNSDGSADLAFGGGDGRFRPNLNPFQRAAAVAVQPDGKILLAGTINSAPGKDFALVRLNSDGTLDTSFGGGDGIAITDLKVNGSLDGLLLHPDGKISAIGSSGFDFLVVRYLNDGTPDTTFSGDGIANANVTANGDVGRSAVLQPDGKLVVVGIANSVASQTRVGLVRYNVDGSLDATFGTGGIVTTDLGTGAGPTDAGHSVVLLDDGRIVVGGTKHGGEFALVRYFDNGALDPSFGLNGILTTNIPNGAPDEGYSLVQQDDGKLILGGYTGLNGDFALARYLPVESTPIVPDSTHYLVVRVDFDTEGNNPITGGQNDRIRLYVDPVPGFEPLVADAEITNVDIGRVNRAGFTAQGDKVFFDEVRMGSSFSDVFDATANGPDRLLTARQVIAGTDGSESVALGDVNGDGLVDLVHAITTADQIAVRLGNGHGLFSDSPLTLNAPAQADTVAVTDLNGDGRADIISANLLGDNVSIWVTDANGQHPTRADYAVASRPDWVELGDFNSDGHVDLITLAKSRKVSVLLNDGTGVFSTRIDRDISGALTRSITVGGQIAVGDLNNDGHLDAAFSTFLDGKVAILYGDGTGALPTISTFDVSGRPDGLAIADVDADGNDDLAIARRGANQVSVWLGDGTGQFPTRHDLSTGRDPFRVQLADFNGDGNVDLATSARIDSTLSIRLGNGNGTFGAEELFAAGFQPANLASSDLDADGDRDLVIGSSVERVAVFRNNTIDPVSGNQTGGVLREIATYDPVFSQITSVTDELGRQTFFDIDPANGNVRKITQVIGALDATSGETDDIVTQFTYTTHGQVDTVTDPLGRVTDYTYDALGRLLSITMAAGTVDEATQSFEYDSAGNATAIIDEHGNRTEFQYDLLNRVTRIKEADPDGATGPLTSPITTFAYDSRGNIIRMTDPQQHVIRSEYDAMDRVTRMIDEQAHETTSTYDLNGNLIRTRDPLGQIVENRYDSRNRLIGTIDPDGGQTVLRYDAANNVTQIIDPVGNVTRYKYDFRNRVTTETDPLGHSIQYQYDGADNLISRIDRNGRETQSFYDDIDRLMAETWFNADGSLANEVTAQYDKASNLTAIDDFFSSFAYTYDQRDRVKTVDNQGTANAPRVILAYTHDDVGNVLSVTDTVDGTAGATTGYAYDALHRTTRITQTGNAVSDKRVDFSYNSLGQYQDINRYSDLLGTDLVVGTRYQYDNLNRLTDLRHNNGNSDVAFYQYAYDADSRITSITDIDGLTNYTYDDRDQLTGAEHEGSNNPDETYTYDANGNRVSSSVHGNGYVTGPGNRLLSDGTYDYIYDNEGNMLRRTENATGAFRDFEWDHTNRLTAVIDRDSTGTETQRVEFTYDAFGRRLSKELTTAADNAFTSYVYDREDVILDVTIVDNSGPQLSQIERRLLHGAGFDQILAQEDRSGGVEWLLGDHLGSIRETLDNTGNVVARLDYTSFGEVSNPELVEGYSYAGREFDNETGMHFYRARYYDANLGRFISEDPLGQRVGLTNEYCYAYNCVLSYVDPLGLEPENRELIRGDLGPVHTQILFWDKSLKISKSGVKVGGKVGAVKLSVKEGYEYLNAGASFTVFEASGYLVCNTKQFYVDAGIKEEVGELAGTICIPWVLCFAAKGTAGKQIGFKAGISRNGVKVGASAILGAELEISRPNNEPAERAIWNWAYFFGNRRGP